MPPAPTSDPALIIDAGLFCDLSATAPATAAATAAAIPATAWLTVPSDFPIHALPPHPAPVFQTIAPPDLAPWLATETRRLLERPANPDPTPPPHLRRFPRLELPTSPATRAFFKTFDHAVFAAWLKALDGHHILPLLLIHAGDYTKTNVDLRQLCSRHRAAPDSTHTHGRHRFALLLDHFGLGCDTNLTTGAPDGAPVSATAVPPAVPPAALDAPAIPPAAEAGFRLGNHQPVYLLARGLPGAQPHEQGRAPADLPPATRARAEALYHAAVGELGTERILFGTGQQVSVSPPDETITTALANWFRHPREWLDPASANLIFHANPARLTSPQ